MSPMHINNTFRFIHLALLFAEDWALVEGQKVGDREMVGGHLIRILRLKRGDRMSKSVKDKKVQIASGIRRPSNGSFPPPESA